MKSKLIQFGAVLLALSAGTACFDHTVISPSQVQDVSQVQAPPPTQAPSPSASPSPGAHGSVAKVEVHFYGTQTCTGLKQPPSGVRVIGLNCVQPVTASPFDAAGTDVGQPTDTVVWNCSSGVELDNPEPNAYNRALKGWHAGSFSCTATVAGVTGTLDGTVVP